MQRDYHQPKVPRPSTTRRLNHNNRPRNLARTVRSDNQAGCRRTCATATGAWAACWRELCGIRAVVTRLLVRISQMNYYEEVEDGGNVHLYISSMAMWNT